MTNTKCGVSRGIVELEWKKSLRPMMCPGFSVWCHSVFPTVPQRKSSWEGWQIGCAESIPVTKFSVVVFVVPLLFAVLYCMSELIHCFDSFLGCERTVVKLPVCSSSTFPLSWINQRPQSWGSQTTHPFFHIKGMSLLSLLCKLVLILYTWPSGTEAQLWLIETTKKEWLLSTKIITQPTQGKAWNRNSQRARWTACSWVSSFTQPVHLHVETHR